MEQLIPPPVRRIVVEREATVVDPPPANGNGAHATPAGGLAPVIRRPEPAAGPKVERMRAEQVTIRYGDKEAVRAVTLPVRQGEVLALIAPQAAARPRCCARSTGSWS
jgi:phosphate transport system ATP-binding protein